MSSTRKLVYASFLIALSIVATRLFSIMIPIGGVGAIRLGFGPVPIMFAGIALGPVAGIAVGALADILGYMLNPMGGAYLPQFTLVSALTGALPPLLLSYRRSKDYTFRDLLLAIGINQLILSIILVPFILYRAFGVPILINVPARVITQIILVPSYASIIHLVYKPLKSQIAAVVPAKSSAGVKPM